MRKQSVRSSVCHTGHRQWANAPMMGGEAAVVVAVSCTAARSKLARRERLARRRSRDGRPTTTPTTMPTTMRALRFRGVDGQSQSKVGGEGRVFVADGALRPGRGLGPCGIERTWARASTSGHGQRECFRAPALAVAPAGGPPRLLLLLLLLLEEVFAAAHRSWAAGSRARGPSPAAARRRAGEGGSRCLHAGSRFTLLAAA